MTYFCYNVHIKLIKLNLIHYIMRSVGGCVSNPWIQLKYRLLAEFLQTTHPHMRTKGAFLAADNILKAERALRPITQ